MSLHNFVWVPNGDDKMGGTGPAANAPPRPRAEGANAPPRCRGLLCTENQNFFNLEPEIATRAECYDPWGCGTVRYVLANFRRPLLGCIDPSDSESRLISLRSSRSRRCASVSRLFCRTLLEGAPVRARFVVQRKEEGKNEDVHTYAPLQTLTFGKRSLRIFL